LKHAARKAVNKQIHNTTHLTIRDHQKIQCKENKGENAEQSLK